MAKKGVPAIAERKYDRDVLWPVILAELSRGKPLLQILEQYKSVMPERRTVYEWAEATPESSAQFARARKLGFDAIAEEAMQILESEPERDERGRIDPGYVQWAKNRFWGRTQLLAKWDPKRYGERLELAGDKNAPLTVQVLRLTDAEKPADNGE
jgi:hypothetical protein